MRAHSARYVLALAAALTWTGAGVAQGPVDYVTVNGSNRFGTIDLTTGAFTQIGGTTNFAPEDLTRFGAGRCTPPTRPATSGP
jgi:hypothetical protein